MTYLVSERAVTASIVINQQRLSGNGSWNYNQANQSRRQKSLWWNGREEDIEKISQFDIELRLTQSDALRRHHSSVSNPNSSSGPVYKNFDTYYALYSMTHTVTMPITYDNDIIDFQKLST